MTETASFREYSKRRRVPIERHLRAVLTMHKLEAKDRGADYQMLVNELASLLRRGGKRLRPLLFLLTYEGYGGRHAGAALEVAVSHELLHSFLLIHDDVIDHDYARWGGPNIAGVYFEKFSSSMSAREALHMAEAQAMLAGDICLSLAQTTLATCGFTSEVVAQLMYLQHASLQTALSGELADIAQSHSKKLPTEAEVLAMYQEKTSSYSFVLPFVSAALSAGAETEVPLLQQLGVALGTAYQLHDDLQSIFADATTTGKLQGGDAHEGKRTVLLLQTCLAANGTQRKQLRRLLHKDSLTHDGLAELQSIITETGAKTHVEQLIADYLARAAELIEQTAISSMGKQCLHDMIKLHFISR